LGTPRIPYFSNLTDVRGADVQIVKIVRYKEGLKRAAQTDCEIVGFVREVTALILETFVSQIGEEALLEIDET